MHDGVLSASAKKHAARSLAGSPLSWGIQSLIAFPEHMARASEDCYSIKCRSPARTAFEEITGHVLERAFWPGITAGDSVAIHRATSWLGYFRLGDSFIVSETTKPKSAKGHLYHENPLPVQGARGESIPHLRQS